MPPNFQHMDFSKQSVACQQFFLSIIIFYVIIFRYGGLAQLVRASASHAEGQRFEPAALHFLIMKKEKLQFITSMIIYGTIGLFRKMIPLSSSMLAFLRAFIGMLFLLSFVISSKKKISADAIARNRKILLISGAILGFNWILLFEAYNYTTVATATLCYYMAPVLMLLISHFVYKEKIGAKKWVCIAVSLVGMALVTGNVAGGLKGTKGVILGLLAAVLYAAIVMNNRRLKDISPVDQTIVQLAVSSAVLLPYILIREGFGATDWSLKCILLVLVVGIVHTGFAYLLYFGTIVTLPTNFVAIGSYIDPAVAVVLSALILKEPMTPLNALGAVLIIASLIVSEFTN